MKITNWGRFLTFICFLIFILALIFAIITKHNEESKQPVVEPYVVSTGETLWSIGTQYRPHFMSIQEYIYNLKQYNNLGSYIYPGQEIQVLVY